MGPPQETREVPYDTVRCWEAVTATPPLAPAVLACLLQQKAHGVPAVPSPVKHRSPEPPASLPGGTSHEGILSLKAVVVRIKRCSGCTAKHALSPDEFLYGGYSSSEFLVFVRRRIYAQQCFRSGLTCFYTKIK